MVWVLVCLEPVFVPRMSGIKRADVARIVALYAHQMHWGPGVSAKVQYFISFHIFHSLLWMQCRFLICLQCFKFKPFSMSFLCLAHIYDFHCQGLRRRLRRYRRGGDALLRPFAPGSSECRGGSAVGRGGVRQFCPKKIKWFLLNHGLNNFFGARKCC